MKDFLEKTLRQSVFIKQTEYLNDRLPLAFQGRYSFYKVETNGLLWIAIKPTNKVSLVMIRKDRAKIEKVSGLNCAIFLDSTTFLKCTLCQGHYDFSFSDFYFIFVCCVETSK